MWQDEKEGSPPAKHPLVSTQFFQWCCKHFAQPVMIQPDKEDSESNDHLEKEFRFMRAARVRKDALEEQRRAGMIDSSLFTDLHLY